MPTAVSYTTEQSVAQPRRKLQIVKAEHITAKPMTIEPQPIQAETRSGLQVVSASHHINSRELSGAEVRNLVEHATESNGILQFPQTAEAIAQAPTAPLEQDPTLQVLNQQIEKVDTEAEQAAKAVTTVDPMQAQLHAKVAGQQLEALEPAPIEVESAIAAQPETVAQSSSQAHQPTVTGKFMSHFKTGDTGVSHGHALATERAAKAA